jgi:peroxiredoxin
LSKADKRWATPVSATARSAIHVLAACSLLATCLAVAASPSPTARSLVNRSAPEFVRNDLAGNSVDLRNFRGKVVLLNFWATWCAPCQLEMPTFAAWERQYGPRGLEVMGVSMDDDLTPVTGLVAKLKLNYPVVMGDANLGRQYGGVLGLPLTYLIDRDGVVRARFQGETDMDTMEKRLQTILAHP